MSELRSRWCGGGARGAAGSGATQETTNHLEIFAASLRWSRKQIPMHRVFGILSLNGYSLMSIWRQSCFFRPPSSRYWIRTIYDCTRGHGQHGVDFAKADLLVLQKQPKDVLGQLTTMVEDVSGLRFQTSRGLATALAGFCAAMEGVIHYSMG